MRTDSTPPTAWLLLGALFGAGCLPHPYNRTLHERALEMARAHRLEGALADLRALEPHLDEDAPTHALSCIEASVRAQAAWMNKSRGAHDVAVKIPGGWANVPIDVGIARLQKECSLQCGSGSELDARYRAACAGAEVGGEIVELERSLKSAHETARLGLHVSLWKQLREIDALAAKIGRKLPNEPAVARAQAEVEALRRQHGEALARVDRFEGDADVIRLLHQLEAYERELRVLDTSPTSPRGEQRRAWVLQEMGNIKGQLAQRARQYGLDRWE